MLIYIKEVLVEVYNSISKIERYYIPLRRVFSILLEELNVLRDNLL